jgi:hypothetical protein
VSLRGSHIISDGRVVVAALAAAVALLLVPAGASAASPVLEFVVPGSPFPVAFTTEGGPVGAEMAGFESLVHCSASHGEGEITGPRSTVSKYVFTGCTTEHGSHVKCHSAGAADEEEIKTGPIDAELVYIDQAKREVAMLLNPGGGTYIAFECGGEAAEGTGSFLAPVAPIDQEATSFLATLSQVGSVETPDEYENSAGEKLSAIPHGKHGAAALVTTGVEATFVIHSNVPGRIRAISTAEVEAAQREAEAPQREAEAARAHEAEVAKEHEELQHLEAALKKVEERAKQLEEANKKHEEEAAKKKQEEESKPIKVTRPKHPPLSVVRADALKQCKKQPPKKIARCEAKVKQRYGGATKHKHG